MPRRQVSARTNCGTLKWATRQGCSAAGWWANTDAFYILWSDIQQNIPLVTSGLEFETNAGSATSYGLEFEFRGQVNDDLTLSLSGSWTHATLDHGVEINGNLVNGTFPGEKVPGVPDYNFNFNARQNFQVSDAITGFASITPAWIGESHGDVVTTNPDYKRPSYITLDASAGIDVGGGVHDLRGEPDEQQQDHPAAGHPGVRVLPVWADL